MDLRKVLFVGGDVRKQASVQIRCLDIAPRLGADHLLNVSSADEIPSGYLAYVCVKPQLDANGLRALARKGKIVWDIIDGLPPVSDIALYLASSRFVQKNFSFYGRVEFIPHHHCNWTLDFNPPGNREPGWIGRSHWLPQLDGCEFARYFTDDMPQSTIIESLRKIGIGLNFRGQSAWSAPKHPARLKFNLHQALNSGIKLINCIGFGIPSVSADEPAYREFEGECTIISNRERCGQWVEELRHNDALYLKLRANCIERAREFHISNIAEQYKTVLQSL